MNGYQQNYPTAFGGLDQQLAPQGLLGGLLGGPVGGLIGRGIGGLFGNSRVGGQIGQFAGGIGGSLLPFGADPITAAYAQQQAQLAPQGFFGNLLGQIGQPLGSAIGGAFGNQQLGSSIGGVASQLGRLLPFDVDPVTAAYVQQAQLAPQGFFGNLLGKIGQPLGTTIGSTFGNPQLGNTIGGVASQLGRFLPFGADPVAAAYAQQQAQLAPQGFFGNLLGQIGQPLGSAIGGAFGNQQLGNTIGGVASQLGRFLPFSADPVAAAYAQQQQAQLAPQGFFGNLLGQIGQPLGSAIGSAFGNQQLGSSIGGVASQLGRILPFDVDPVAAAYAQQQQLAPQGFFGNLLGKIGQPLGSAIGGAFGNQQLGNTIGGVAGQLGRFLPFGADPVAAAYAQQQQLAPQGFFGNLLGQIGQPLGSAIGGAFGNSQLGGAIGGAASQLGRFLPFGADPTWAAYAQQQGAYPGSAGLGAQGAYAGQQQQQPTIH